MDSEKFGELTQIGHLFLRCPPPPPPTPRASQNVALPHPSIMQIPKSHASQQHLVQNDGLHAKFVSLPSWFAQWPTIYHHSVHLVIIPPHIPFDLSQTTYFHAHQPCHSPTRPTLGKVHMSDMHVQSPSEATLSHTHFDIPLAERGGEKSPSKTSTWWYNGRGRRRENDHLTWLALTDHLSSLELFPLISSIFTSFYL